MYAIRSYYGYIYEKHHDLIISDDAVTAAVKLAIRYINDRFLPDKAIDLLDEAAAKAKLAGSLVPQEIKLLSDIVEELGKESEEALAARITSYNVCYTKLLRADECY